MKKVLIFEISSPVKMIWEKVAKIESKMGFLSLLFNSLYILTGISNQLKTLGSKEEESISVKHPR